MQGVQEKLRHKRGPLRIRAFVLKWPFFKTLPIEDCMNIHTDTHFAIVYRSMSQTVSTFPS